MNPEGLQAVSLAVAAETSVDGILSQIVNGLGSRSEVALARVWLIGRGDDCQNCRFRDECPDTTRCLHLSASAGAPLDRSADWSRLDGTFKRIPIGIRKVGRIAVSGEGILVEDATSEHDWIARPDWAREEHIRSFGGQPLIFKGEVLGVLGVFSRDPIDRSTFAWLRTFADHAAISIAQARATAQLQLLLEINNAVASHLDLKELMRAISSSLRRILPHEGAFITLLTSDGARLRVQSLDLPTPDSTPFEEDVEIAPEGTPEGEAIASRQPVLVGPKIDASRFFSPWVRKAFESGVRSGCAVPLIVHGRPLGALSVISRSEAAFDDESGRLLERCSTQIAIAVDHALAYRELEENRKALAQQKSYLESEIRAEGNFDEIIGNSHALRNILRQIERVAPTDSTVLIRGETGTGKELIARAIHDLSVRRKQTLVKVNCAAIPTGLIESELFGHEKGAFTGAISQRIGRFELAHRGTLFLDEVGDIPLELQPKLLRVLQEREFERLGSTRTQQVDVRLVAATNCDLEKMVADRAFRSDLYYRLNIFPVTVPPLRERPGDIPLLVRFFVERFARRMRRPIAGVSEKTMTALTQYHWPGNIRELENMIERAVILATGTVLDISIGEIKLSPALAVNPTESASPSTLESVEREHILRVLEGTRWVITDAAGQLGMKRTTLQGRMRKLGISRRRNLRSD